MINFGANTNIGYLLVVGEPPADDKYKTKNG